MYIFRNDVDERKSALSLTTSSRASRHSGGRDWASDMAADATPASGSIDAKLAAHAELARALASDVVERPGLDALLDAVDDLAHPDRLVAFAASEALGTLARRAAANPPPARHSPVPIFPPAVTARLLDAAAADDAPSREKKRPRIGASETTTTRPDRNGASETTTTRPGRGAFRALVLLRSAVKLEATARDDARGGRERRGGDDVVESVRARRGELLSALARDAAAAETAPKHPDDRRHLRLYATLRLLTASDEETERTETDADEVEDADSETDSDEPADEAAIRRATHPSSPAYVAHAGVARLARAARRRRPSVVFDLVRDAGLARWPEDESSQDESSLATPSPFTRRDAPGGEDALRRRAWLACWTAARRAAEYGIRHPNRRTEKQNRLELPPGWPVPSFEGGAALAGGVRREAARRLVALFAGEDDALVRFLDASLRLRAVVAAVAGPNESAIRDVPDAHDVFDALIRSVANDDAVLMDMLMDPGGKDDDGADDFRRFALGYAKAVTREPRRASRDVVECLAALRATLESSTARMPFDPGALVRRLDVALRAVARTRRETREANESRESTREYAERENAESEYAEARG